MDKFQRFIKITNKRELTFLAIGILMLVIVLAAAAYSIRFLVVKLNTALNPNISASTQITRFEFQKVQDVISK